MKKLVDLTQPIITGHWRYNNEIRAHSNMHEGAYSNVTYYTMRTHMFTHIIRQFDTSFLIFFIIIIIFT